MTRNVQTVLPDPLYEKLAAQARRQSKPIKAVVLQAIEAYVNQTVPWDEDPLAAFVGSGSLGGNWSTRKDWRA